MGRCGDSGSSSGGSHGSGKIDYPGYMKNAHARMLRLLLGDIDVSDDPSIEVNLVGETATTANLNPYVTTFGKGGVDLPTGGEASDVVVPPSPDAWLAEGDRYVSGTLPYAGRSMAAFLASIDDTSAIYQKYADAARQLFSETWPEEAAWPALSWPEPEPWQVDDEEGVADSVSEFSRSEALPLARSVEQFVAAMSEAGAANSSAVGIGVAMLHLDALRRVAQYEADLRQRDFDRRSNFRLREQELRSAYELREKEIQSSYTLRELELKSERLRIFASLVDSAARSMIGSAISTLDGYRALAQIATDWLRARIQALQDEADKIIDRRRAAVVWGIDLFQYASNVLAGISGGTVRSGAQERESSGLSIGGALAGAGSAAITGAPLLALGGPAGPFLYAGAVGLGGALGGGLF